LQVVAPEVPVLAVVVVATERAVGVAVEVIDHPFLMNHLVAAHPMNRN
jgi:hypothetical protein